MFVKLDSSVVAVVELVSVEYCVHNSGQASVERDSEERLRRVDVVVIADVTNAVAVDDDGSKGSFDANILSSHDDFR